MEQNSRIILLPVTNNEDTSSDIDKIISLTRSVEESEGPEWVSNINIPNESVLKDELDTAEKALFKTRNEYNNLIKHKRLLYDYSYALQDLCEFTLKEFGAIIKPSVVSDEFIIEFKDKEALVEVKGKNKSIDKDDIGQLITDIGQHISKVGNPIKGLFIGNGWRNIPIEDRDVGNKRTFPKEIVQIADAQNIGLLSSVELFNAYCQMIDGKLSKEVILDTILTSNGVIHF